MREIVKIRSVAGSLVVSLPQSVLEPVGLRDGDRVVVEAAPPRRLVITKEGATLTSIEHLELEIDLLEKKKSAIESDLSYKRRQYDHNTPCEKGMDDSDIAILMMMELGRDRDRLDVEIAQKRLDLYGIQGGAVSVVPTNTEAVPGKRGRRSAYIGTKIKVLKKTEETGLRSKGNVRFCWDIIKDGMAYETYREKAGERGGLARRCLADFIVKGFVEVMPGDAAALPSTD
jgi:antitoxin component of MazEF toxin-antitoxin module